MMFFLNVYQNCLLADDICKKCGYCRLFLKERKMLLSLALIFITGLCFAAVFIKIKLPQLIGFLAAGIILGPFVLDLIDIKILNISAELRQIALIIILIRAGLSLKIDDLKKIGKPAVLMCFVPALFEIGAVTVLAVLLFKIQIVTALILGSVLAAVSPAVIVPRMIKMKEENIGVKKGIPQLLMAGASVDDIIVIILFTAFIGVSSGGSFNLISLINIPVSIILGAIYGIVSAFILIFIFKKIHIRDSLKLLVILSAAFFAIALENFLKAYIGFSGLIAVMTMGIVIYEKYEILAKRLSGKFSKLWIAAEILLFVMVGAAVNLTVIKVNLLFGSILILCALLIRMSAVFLCLIKTKFNYKERLFCAISYTPKATVQAAIGGVPLMLLLAGGELILSIAVLSIIITAPIGAYLIDFTKNRLIKD
jgi:NhaP-type Na+/H+ or K+/H+ antiporter